MFSGIVFDSHCDTLMEVVEGRRSLGERSEKGHIDLPRLLEAGVTSQVFAIWLDDKYLPGEAVKTTLRFIDTFYRELETSPDKLMLATKVADVWEAKRRSMVAGFLAIEGGEALEGSISALRMFYKLGVRLMTLTWSRRNQIADGVYEARTGGGLTRFGVEVVKEMNRLGMAVDVSHLSERGFWDVMEVAEKPVVATHSNARAVWDHPRNLTDDQLRAIARSGGIVGATFVGPFIGQGKQSVENLVNHIDHMVEVMGIEHVGIGSDFDGTSDESLPEEIRNVTDMPAVAQALLRRGYSEGDVRKIMGLNWLRALALIFNEDQDGGRV